MSSPSTGYYHYSAPRGAESAAATMRIENNADDEEDDLAPCAGTMIVALARAALKHLSSRDGTNLCSEDLTLGHINNQHQNNNQQHEDQLAVALDEIADTCNPLETRLFGGLAVLSHAMDPRCFVGLIDPQVLMTFRLGARALALCELMRETADNGGRNAETEFTDDELRVVESTLRCYMCISCCALGGWERAHQISELIRDDNASPFRDVESAKMFKVLVACTSQLQTLTLEALARRSGTYQSNQQYPSSGGATNNNNNTNNNNQSSTNNNPADDPTSTLNTIMTTLNHARKLVTTSLEQSMLHITTMAISAAVLTEKTETLIDQVRDQDFAAETEQRKLFRKLRLCKDPNECKTIQTLARDVSTVQEMEVRKTVGALDRVSVQLWRVICDCVLGNPTTANHNATSTSTSPSAQKRKPNATTPASSASSINAGCAVTVAECLRGLLLIRSIPMSDKALCSGVTDLNMPVTRSVVAALGDASPWSLHIRLTAVLALLRHPELPPPSPVVAWSISPDVLTSRWRPPEILITRAQEMAAVVQSAASGANVHRPSLGGNKKNKNKKKKKKKTDDDDQDDDDDHDDSDDENDETMEVVHIADWCADVTESMMLLDEVTIQRDRVLGLLPGGGRGSTHNNKSATNTSSSSSSFSSSLFPLGFDNCEYLGGASKVASLVDCLDRLITSGSGNNDNNFEQQSSMLSVAGAGGSGGSGAPHRRAASQSSVGAPRNLPMLPDSVLVEARRLRSLISKKVPVADAVAAETRRNSPRSRGGGSPPPTSRKDGGASCCGRTAATSPGGAGTAAATSSMISVVKKPKLSVVPSGGVIRNMSEIKFNFDALAPGVELLVSVSHGSSQGSSSDADPSSRIFKPCHDPNGKFVLNIGKYAPGWAEVHAIIHDSAAEAAAAHRDASRASQRAAVDNLTDPDGDMTDDAVDDTAVEQRAPPLTVIAARTARFYVVTHGDLLCAGVKKKK